MLLSGDSLKVPEACSISEEYTGVPPRDPLSGAARIEMLNLIPAVPKSLFSVNSQSSGCFSR